MLPLPNSHMRRLGGSYWRSRKTGKLIWMSSGAFMPRFNTFLEVLKECEAKKIQDGSLSHSQQLSIAMEKSMETGLFWICLASRHSSMFDEIYWKFIDPRFYGPFTAVEDRLGLLSEEERANIDTIVEQKMLQASEGTFVSHYSIDELVDL